MDRIFEIANEPQEDTNMVANSFANKIRESTLNQRLSKDLKSMKDNGMSSNHAANALRLHENEVSISLAKVASGFTTDLYGEAAIHAAYNTLVIPNDPAIFRHLPTQTELNRLKTDFDLKVTKYQLYESKQLDIDLLPQNTNALAAVRNAQLERMLTLLDRQAAAVADARNLWEQNIAYAVNIRKAASTLKAALTIDDIVSSAILKICPTEILSSWDDETAGRKSRTSRQLPPDMVALRSKIPEIFLRDVKDFLRHYDLMTRLRNHYGLVYPYQRNNFIQEIKTSSQYKMTDNHRFMDWHATVFMPIVNCINSARANTFTCHEIYENLTTIFTQDVKRYRVTNQNAVIRMRVPTWQDALTTTQELNNLLQEYRAIDDIFWENPKRRGKHADCNPVLEINATWPGKATKTSQKDRNKTRGGDQNWKEPVCWHCGDKHTIKECAIKKSGKPQTPAGVAAKEAFKANRKDRQFSKNKRKKNDEDEESEKKKKSKAKDDNMIEISSSPSTNDVNSVTISSVDLPVESNSAFNSVWKFIPIDSGAQVTTMPVAHPKLSNRRSTDQILSFGNHSTAKVECIGDLGEIRDIMVNKDTKPLLSMAKLCKDNKIPIVVTADTMYLLKPDSRPRILESDILMLAPLKDGLYKANFAELLQKVGKVSE